MIAISGGSSSSWLMEMAGGDGEEVGVISSPSLIHIRRRVVLESRTKPDLQTFALSLAIGLVLGLRLGWMGLRRGGVDHWEGS